MAYIIVVNPAILEAAGIPKGPSVTATILSAAFGTLIMGVYAKRPFALAPYMGENAFITFTVVRVLGCPWQTALGAIFIAGAIFAVLTLLKVRGWMAEAIPQSLKFSFAVGIGLFLTFVGLNETGIVSLGVPGAPVNLGRLSQPSVLLAVAGFFIIIWLTLKKIRGAIILGILATTILSIAWGISPLPKSFVSLPPSPGPLFLQLDIAGALSPTNLPIVLIIFVMAYVDTVGTLIGLSARGGLLDTNGNLPEIEKPMLADAVANLIAPMLGTTTTGRVHRVSCRDRRRGQDGLYRARGCRTVPACAVLLANPHVGAAPCLRDCADRHRQLHDQPDHAHRLPRLYRAHSGLPDDRADDLYVQYRRRHDRGPAQLSAPQDSRREI